MDLSKYNYIVLAQGAEVGSLSANAKMGKKKYVRRVFTIFARNVSFWRIIANLQIQYSFLRIIANLQIQYNLQYIPCISPRNTVLTQKSTFYAQSLPKSAQIVKNHNISTI